MYDPTVGRFFQPDPIWPTPGEANPFLYTANSPTNATDPSGLELIVEGEWALVDTLWTLTKTLGFKYPRVIPLSGSIDSALDLKTSLHGGFVYPYVANPTVPNHGLDTQRWLVEPSPDDLRELIAKKGDREAAWPAQAARAAAQVGQSPILTHIFWSYGSVNGHLRLSRSGSDSAMRFEGMSLRPEEAWQIVQMRQRFEAHLEKGRREAIDARLAYPPKPLRLPPGGVSGINYTEFRQTSRTNCWVAATVVALAYQRPRDIKEMITDNGDGTFTVKLYDRSTMSERKIVVTKSDRKIICATFVPEWAGILELAMIKQGGEYYTEFSGLYWHTAISLLTGKGAGQALNIPGPGFALPFRPVESLLRKANNGKIVIAGTGEGNGIPGLIDTPHVYAVLGFDEGTKQVRICDPRGYDPPATRRVPGGHKGEFWVTLEEFERGFLAVAYEGG